MRLPSLVLTIKDWQHILYYKGKEHPKLNGTGFLSHKKLKGNVKEFNRISDRVSSVISNYQANMI